MTYEELDSENDILFEQVQSLKRENDRLRCELDRVKPDSWERVIEDALSAKWSSRGERSAEFDALVARCKALCERTNGCDAE